MEGIIDNVKVRVRSHNPRDIESGEFRTIQEAIDFLERLKLYKQQHP